MIDSNTVLFAGAQTNALLRDGSSVSIRVRELPARHHLELIELFHLGRESDLIQRCAERGTPAEAGAVTWTPVDAAFIDNLTDDSHAQLLAICEKLNFARAVATAQRQIARGQNLRPVTEMMAKQMMAPMRKELDSWMSSLTSQLSAVLAAKKP